MFGGAASLLAFLLPAPAPANAYVCGDIRVEVLSDSLVRVEQKGPNGFEDRATFNVVSRDFQPSRIETSDLNGLTTISTPAYQVVLPSNAHRLSEVTVKPTGAPEVRLSDRPVRSQFLPAPGKMPRTWTMSDNPRMVPPAWGATPATISGPGSGWDRSNDAPDTYVFVPNDYQNLRRDFLALTGHTEKPPLYAFGFFDSRYHPYTEAEAVGVIDTYRKKKIPIDLFTVDTDWRVNGSHGYEVERKYFPDMRRFLKEAHDRNVRVMFNDHPEPVAADALDPREMTYRYNGLTSILDMGVDVWWFDRNWGVTLKEPMPGIAHEEWGQQVYHDITQRYRPNQRPLIMTNFQGIDNGIRNYAPQPAGHRYPIWWTGDTRAQWEYLRRGVENGVDMGLLALTPYVGEDLGGHVGQPSPDLYVRYLQYGCLSPTTRVHCTRGQTRYPWEFGSEAEKIVTDFVRMRYRLLPTIYSAAQRNYEDGTPLLRRCDLEWPQYAEAARNDEYMLGDDILVAPIIASETEEAKPLVSDGFKAEFFAGKELQGSPLLTRTDTKIAFEWGEGSPDPKVPNDNFSARWTGQTAAAPKTGDYTFVVRSDDGVRLWVNGKKVIDAWMPQFDITQTARVHLSAGERASVRLEYFEATGGAEVSVGWISPADGEPGVSHRQAWIPPGEWRSVYNGEVVRGPRMVTASAKLSECPMWVRSGALVTLAPDMQYTSEKPWDTLTVDAWVLKGAGSVARRLSEDDGTTNGYRTGSVVKTKLEMTRKGDGVGVYIGAAEGRSDGFVAKRKWLVRLNLPKNTNAVNFKLDGQPVRARRIASADRIAVPFGGGTSPAAGGDVYLVEVAAGAPTSGHKITFEVRD